MSFKLNPKALKQIEKAIDDSWAEVVAALDVEYTRVIEDDNEFSDLGFTDQDMVDSGEFRDGQTVDVKARRALWRWAPINPKNGYCYAAALYYGFYAFGDQERYVEGRPWVSRAIRNIGVLVRFATELEKRGLKTRIVRQNVPKFLG